MPKTISLVPYKSLNELKRVHPDIQTLQAVYQIPRGQTAEGILATLEKKQVKGQLFQLGNFVWKEAEPMPKIKQKEGATA